MLRRPLFWILFLTASGLALLFTVQYFSAGFPIVGLDLRMDRDEALSRASELAERFTLGTEEYTQAATFGVDTRFQTYVELEAGGAERFREFLDGEIYSPYSWEVRHFQPGEVREARFWFTPAGEPYGFRENLPEDEPGASLSAEQAEAIAREGARTWQVDLSRFNLQESSQEVRPGGRTDHTFVWEMPDTDVGEARFRLRVEVSGDRLTEIRHYVQIPETFSRRYQEMRSANSLISTIGGVAIALLYIVVGCLGGLFYLLRKRRLTWKMPLLWASIVAFLQFAASLNQLPLSWMEYDTALSWEGFLFRQLTGALGSAFVLGLLLWLTFMAAEGLTRQAFPRQVQLWKLWSRGVANSPTVMGQTSAGYLLVPLFFAYEVLLYLLSSRILGWWTPSNALIEPDTLATYLPWLTPIAVSTQAGFWEECLFRAIPLAGAALIGSRLGGKRYWIGGALILQAVIFGAGHANYAAQPSYARLVELILPSIGFGLLYLAFGLLPAVVLHYTFDVVWFALPIFVSNASGIWLDQLMVVLLTLVPLWAVLFRRSKAGNWSRVPDSARNAGWEKPPKSEAEERDFTTVSLPPISVPVRRAVLLLGGAGLLVWAILGDFASTAPSLEIDRGEALQLTEEHLEKSESRFLEGYERLASVIVPFGRDDRFIWEKGGVEKYQQLLGSYLDPPHWRVRMARFAGELEERAEEYRLHLSPAGEVLRFHHQIPESRPGAHLQEEEARRIAHRALEQRLNLSPEVLEEVSSEPSQRPERLDWLFTFANPHDYPLEDGQARVDVRIAGDQLVGVERYVHLPEDWLRGERSRRNLLQIVESTCTVLLGGLLLLGAVISLIQWTRGRFSATHFLTFFALVALILLFDAVNQWPAAKAGFSTSQPYNHQLMFYLAGTLLQVLFLGGGVALLAGYLHHVIYRMEGADGLWPGFATGGVFAGCAALVLTLTAGSVPDWPGYAQADHLFPRLGTMIDPIPTFILLVLYVLLLVVFLQHIASRTTLAAILGAIGLALAGSRGIESLGSWLATGACFAIVLFLAYWFIFRSSPSAIPPALALLAAANQVQQGWEQPFPGAWSAETAAALLLPTLGFYWYKRLYRHPEDA